MRLPGLGRLRRILNDRKVRKLHHAHRMKHASDYLIIDKILRQFRTAGGLKHDYQDYKLYSLWQLLLAERPQRILELGTGTSTAIFAEYVRSYGGQLWSIDESEKWLANSRKLADIEADDERFHMTHAEKKVVYSNGNPVEIGYDISLQEPFDFVLVDGPSLRVKGERFKQAVNSDVFDIIDHAPPKLVVVDIRVATAEAISKKFPEIYHCEFSDVIRGKVREGYRYFSEFRFNH